MDFSRLSGPELAAAVAGIVFRSTARGEARAVRRSYLRGLARDLLTPPVDAAGMLRPPSQRDSGGVTVEAVMEVLDLNDQLDDMVRRRSVVPSIMPEVSVLGGDYDTEGCG